MTKVRGHILPFFIPHLGCPQQCVFCDQRTISGVVQQPSRDEILQAMEDNRESCCELAFYGGSFTAMPAEQQLYYLETARIGLERQWISGVRVSTRPDAIDEKTLARLRAYGVSTVELGVQSMNDTALRIARRGHRAEDSLRSVRMLKDAGFTTGVQLMPGLPGDDRSSVISGAAEILALCPDLLRIYPTVVVAGTELADMYEQGQYQPLALPEAVEIAAVITLLAERYSVAVIRTGLNTDGHLAAQVAAGPYHPAFGNLVKSYIWRQKVLRGLRVFAAAGSECEKITVYANRSRLPLVFGQNAANRQYYEAAAVGSKLKIKSFNDVVTAGADDVVVMDSDGRRLVCRHEDFAEDFLAQFGQ